MHFYLLLSRLPWPNSYIGKILFVSFLGVHVPLIGLILYLLLSGDFSLDEILPVVLVILVATLAGTAATFAAIYALLAPVRSASAAIRAYLTDRVLPRLPGLSGDEAAQLLQDVQEGLTRLDAALQAVTASRDTAVSERRELFSTLSRLSHDLRTPINAIVGFSQIMHHEMLGPVGSEAYRDYARNIQTSGETLLERVQAILELSRLEAETAAPERRPVQLSGVLEQALRGKHLHAAGRQIELRSLPAAGVTADSDAPALEQALANLLTVALETTPPEGRVTCSLALGEGVVELTVADTGRPLTRAEVPDALAERGDGGEVAGPTDAGGIPDASSLSVFLLLADRLAAQAGAELRWHTIAGKGKLFKLSLPAGARRAAA